MIAAIDFERCMTNTNIFRILVANLAIGKSLAQLFYSKLTKAQK